MTELEQKALLPAGLRDILPPIAAYEAELMERLVACFAQCGYDRVKAPMVEFEEGLLSGAGGDVSRETFRLMDPVSQRMMGVRADITPQIARIASTRLRNEPRPLRLSYSGEVLRVRGSQLRPERQFAQVGAELIGAEGAAADAEIIVMATEALAQAGIENQTIDLTIPPLVPALCDGLELSESQRAALRHALDRKDVEAVAKLGGQAAKSLCALLESAGPAEACFAELENLDLPPAAAEERERAGAVMGLLRTVTPSAELTLDPVENRGFEYHTGVSFTIFAPGERGELGAGGRYAAPSNENGSGEPATGFTLYVDTIMRVLPEAPPARKVYLPPDTPPGRGRELRDDGWITVAALDATGDIAIEARRLGCSHVLEKGKARPLDQG